MQNARKAVWSIPYVVSIAFFPSLKQNFIVYRSCKVSSRPDCIFEIHQLWQSDVSRVYSNCCCSCSFEPEIIKIGQSSHEMYSNNILDFHESTTILNACTKSLETYWMQPRIRFQAFLSNTLVSGLVSLFKGISTFVGYSVSKPSLWKKSCGSISSISWGKREFMPFPKVNVIARLEFEAAYYDFAVQH